MQRKYDDLRDYYVYNANVASLAAADDFTDTVSIEADADFVLIKMSGFADIAGGPQTNDSRVIPLVDIQLTDTGSGRQLLNGNTAWNNIFGQGGLPYILPIPRYFKANSTLRVSFTNFSLATTYRLAIAFSGIKDFGKVYTERQGRGR